MQAKRRARSNNPTLSRLRWPKNHTGPETVREIPPRPSKDARSREEQHCDSATGRELAKLRVQLRCLQHEFELEILRRQEARAAQRESEEAHALEVESLRLAVQQAETRARHARVLAEIRERETLRRCHLATTAMVLARCELASLRKGAARTVTNTGEHRVGSKHPRVCQKNDDDKHEKQENKQDRNLALVTSSPSSVGSPNLRRNSAAKERRGRMENQQWHERETRHHADIDALRSRARHAERELIAIHQDLCHARERVLMLESTSGDPSRVEKQHSQGKQVEHHDGKTPLLLVARRNPEQENSHDNDICLGGRVHTGNLLEEFVCTKREVRVLREALAHAEESKLRAEDRATAAEKRARRAERRSSRISAESDFVKQEARAVFAALRQRDAHLSDLVDFTLQDL